MKVLFSGNHAMVSQSRTLYTLIRKSGPVTRQFLCQQLSQPATTLSRTLDRLIRAGLISETGLAESSGGRRPILYQTVGSSYYLFGLDLETSPAQLVLTDLHLQVVGSSQLGDLAGQAAAGQSAVVAAACAVLCEQSQIQPEQVLGLGISLPGFDACGQPDLESAAMREAIAASLQIPVFQTASLLAVRYFARWRKDAPADTGFLELVAGRQVQLRLVLNDQFVLNSSLPERSGQMIVPAPDKFSGSGNGATLGQLASQTSILQRFQRIKDDPGLTWTDFCQAVQAGKRKSGQILQEAAAAMAVTIYNASLLTGCNYLLLDGPLWLDLPESVKALRDKLTEIQSPEAPAPGIQILSLEDAHKAIGSAAFVLENYLGENP